jgi:phage tail sheath gpL-like
MNRRALTTIVLLCSAVVFAAVLPPIAFAQNNPFVGTWKFNLEKSKYLGAAPKSITSIIEAVGQGLRATVELIDAQGNAAKVDYGVFFLDGKSYPIVGSPAFDAASYKLVNDHTIEITRTKAGKVVRTSTRVVAADGKTSTVTTTSVDANGQQRSDVAVEDKQ